MANPTADQCPAFPALKVREGEYNTAVDCYDREDADAYIEWQRQEIERLRRALVAAETALGLHRDVPNTESKDTDDVTTVQPAPRIARCSKCERVAANSMAGQRCFAEDACGIPCDGTLFTVL